MGANEVQIRAQNYYEAVQFVIPFSGNQAAWTSLCSNLFPLDNPFPSEQLTNEQCQVSYGKYSMENLAWTMSLVLMSWTLRNFQRKIEDGHCNNTTHPHGATNPRNCDMGQTFHRDMFNRCLKLYRDVINTFDPPPQTPAGTQNTTNPTP